MEHEIMEQLKLIVENMATKDDLNNLRTELREEIKASETRTHVFIENTVTNQIKALFDGYQGALENQALLKIANDALANQIDDLKTRVTALEHKIA